MTPGAEVVVEVMLDGDLIVYDPDNFDEIEAAGFYQKYEWLDRNYFVATLELVPVGEEGPS